MNCRNEFVCKYSKFIHYRLSKMEINCKASSMGPFGPYYDYFQIDNKGSVLAFTISERWVSLHNLCCINMNWAFLIALCGSSPDFDSEPKSNWFVMENKVLVLEFQSRKPNGEPEYELPYGVELELKCSNSTRKSVHRSKLVTRYAMIDRLWIFNSVDNSNQTPTYEFENNLYYEKDCLN